MFNLNSRGDSTINLLNLDLFYKGGIPFLCSKFIKIQNVICQLIFETLEIFFSFQLPLNSSFKNGIKNWEIQNFKIYVRMTSANVTSQFDVWCHTMSDFDWPDVSYFQAKIGKERVKANKVILN